MHGFAVPHTSDVQGIAKFCAPLLPRTRGRRHRPSSRHLRSEKSWLMSIFVLNVLRTDHTSAPRLSGSSNSSASSASPQILCPPPRISILSTLSLMIVYGASIREGCTMTSFHRSHPRCQSSVALPSETSYSLVVSALDD